MVEAYRYYRSISGDYSAIDLFSIIFPNERLEVFKGSDGKIRTSSGEIDESISSQIERMRNHLDYHTTWSGRDNKDHYYLDKINEGEAEQILGYINSMDGRKTLDIILSGGLTGKKPSGSFLSRIR